MEQLICLASSTMPRPARPLMWHTKPTPQLSCSSRGRTNTGDPRLGMIERVLQVVAEIEIASQEMVEDQPEVAFGLTRRASDLQGRHVAVEGWESMRRGLGNPLVNPSMCSFRSGGYILPKRVEDELHAFPACQLRRRNKIRIAGNEDDDVCIVTRTKGSPPGSASLMIAGPESRVEARRTAGGRMPEL